MQAGYGEDLAHIHDVGYGAFADAAAEGLLELFRQNKIREGRITDLGCGSGIWANALVNNGYDVLGVDLSPDMISMARQRVPRAEFRVESFLNTELPPCRAITALGEVLNYRFDERNSLATLTSFFHQVYDALQPGGLFVFDLAAPGRNENPRQAFREGPDWTCLVEFKPDRENQQLTRSIVTFRKQGDWYRRDEEVHRLQLYSAPEICNILRETGFDVSTVDHYGTFQFPEAWIGYICRKF